MNICVFAASSDAPERAYFEAAYELGVLLARGGHRLIFGGGATGLMGACARGALENGGEALGVAPRFFDEPGILLKEGCSFFFTETMAQRKTYMAQEAGAFIALPGGIGTYEEFFEVLTLKQLGQHDKPMAMLNTLGYYDPFQAMLRRTAEKGFMGSGILRLYALCETPEEALAHVTAGSSAPQAPRGVGSYGK
ncbi:MAG: TIGR00730 family Rossman fold protein [Oscillospiraceae bacterium]|nr:TIGR00730 family Rossman fold protein [Oscillospiraceae bacterium]